MTSPVFSPRRKKLRLVYIRRVVGVSMLPTLRPGQIVLALGLLPLRAGDIVVAEVGGREVIKRIATIDEAGAMLLGDNLSSSTDSRDYGSVDRSFVRGRVVFVR